VKGVRTLVCCALASIAAADAGAQAPNAPAPAGQQRNAPRSSAEQTNPAQTAPQQNTPAAVSTTPQATTETYGDWIVICSVAPAGTVCEADSSLNVRGQQGAIARIAFAKPAKDRAMRLVVQTPVSISIAPGVKVEAQPGKSAVALAYRTCTPGGCFADADTTSEQMQAFRAAAAGEGGRITITDATGRALELPVSFRGLDVALDALAKK
jgi:invasion protein IalB